jgi:very-short-patch-repair endonuclease
MTPLLVCLVLLFCALLLAPRVLRALKQQKTGEAWPFIAKKPLSNVEQALYFRLIDALPELIVLAQVPMSSFLRVRRGQTWSEWHGRISQKSVDYLICERDFGIVVAIELDDSSHDSPARVHADATKSRALTAAGVTLVRWRTTAMPDVALIRSVVEDIRDRKADGRDGLVVARVEPRLHVTRIDASNDPSISSFDVQR